MDSPGSGLRVRLEESRDGLDLIQELSEGRGVDKPGSRGSDPGVIEVLHKVHLQFPAVIKVLAVELPIRMIGDEGIGSTE